MDLSETLSACQGFDVPSRMAVYGTLIDLSRDPLATSFGTGRCFYVITVALDYENLLWTSSKSGTSNQSSRALSAPVENCKSQQRRFVISQLHDHSAQANSDF